MNLVTNSGQIYKRFIRIILVSVIAMSAVWSSGLLPTAALTAPDFDQTSANLSPSPAADLRSTSATAQTRAPADTYTTFLPMVFHPPELSWPMAGANPERTSWTPEEVQGNLQPEWYRVIDSYIPAKVQIIAANNTLFVSTANGLYAFDSNTGAQRWVYATDMPLGNSPTIYNGVAYVGGFDHKLHAIDIMSGQKLWTFDGAGAGYDTNPLIANGLVYLGNRDGYFYAIYSNDSPNRGQLAWRFQSGGPIHFSAAYKDNKVYFASDDSSAYALNATSGALIWKSAKLPVTGFHSWWPMIYTDARAQKDVVIFVGSENYRLIPPGPTEDIQNLDADNYLYNTPLYNNEIGRRDAQGRLDASATAGYLESYPWRRTYFVLDAGTGLEQTYDLTGNGKPDYAPVVWWGTRSGQRYPPIAGGDGLIYQANVYWVNPPAYATRGHVTGWVMGTKYIAALPNGGTQASDEPMAYSAGGNVIYWNLCCDRTSGAFNVKSGDTWSFFSYNLSDLIQGYNSQTTGTFESNAVEVYGNSSSGSGWGNQPAGWNGVYGYHGDQNPPIPYKGRVYMHRGNAIIAWSPSGGSRQLPEVPIPARQPHLSTVDVNALQQILTNEVQKMLDAGHLRPGFGIHGAFSLVANSSAGDRLTDYFHNTADTLYALSIAYPYLSPDLQNRVKAYLQSEYANYSPCVYTSNGWAGASREWGDLPPEVESAAGRTGPSTDSLGYPGWDWPPFTFYALWKYAQIAGNAPSLFNACKNLLGTPPDNNTLVQYPEAHNAWIAGYVGYIQLAKLAGNTAEANQKQATLNQLLSSRVSNFPNTINNPWGPDSHNYAQTLSVARNFMYLTPELGQYLHDNAASPVTAAFNLYTTVAPYWFVTKFEASYAETLIQPLYDYSALFAAKAMIFGAPREELASYLDVPAFARGDLFYIQNLVYTIQANSQASGPATSRAGQPATGEPKIVTAVPPQAENTAADQRSSGSLKGSGAIPAPTATYTVNLPMIMRTEGPLIGAVTPLAATVGQYEKFETAFQLKTVATNVYLPYDPAPLEGQTGISVDMLATTPAGDIKTVPCFYYQPVDANLAPVGAADWRCRLAPETTGTWLYSIRATDATGTSQSPDQSFDVAPSASHGFIRVSSADPRYFEFSDGTPFLAPLVNVEWGNHLNSLDSIRSTIPLWGQNGVRFVRWFPTGESANFYIIPFGDNIKSSWGFGPTYINYDPDPATGHQFSFEPYYYSSQSVPTVPGDRYRLTFRARVEGNKVFRPQVGDALTEIRASGWQNYTLMTTASGNSLTVDLRDGYTENDNTPGTIRVYGVTLQHDEGNGNWGSNLLTRSDPDTFQYVDQIGAARLDEVLRLSEQYGVYHKLTLFHKNDDVLAQLDANGQSTNWSVDNFYAPAGSVMNRYERAYARYFVARWSYSTALHSIELANENMLSQDSYDTAYDILGYIYSIEPRHIMLSNSFWGYFVKDFWADPARGYLMDYADKHWYARPGSDNPTLVSTIYDDSAANVRECQAAFAWYAPYFNVNKPIVRGETGVWDAGGNVMDLGSGATTYYHKQLWAQMGDQCAGEWYTAFLRDHNLWGMYGLYERFLQGEPINNGHYTNIGTDVNTITVANSSGSARAWGKLDATAGRGFVWIDNANDTWKHVTDGVTIAPASATIMIEGLPDGAYTLNWYNTYTGGVVTTTNATVNGQLALTVKNLQHDVAVKFQK